MAHHESNGHVSDDVTWPWKLKVVTPIRLKPNIWKRLDTDGPPLENVIWPWRIEWSRDWWRHGTHEGQGPVSNIYEVYIISKMARDTDLVTMEHL